MGEFFSGVGEDSIPAQLRATLWCWGFALCSASFPRSIYPEASHQRTPNAEDASGPFSGSRLMRLLYLILARHLNQLGYLK